MADVPNAPCPVWRDRLMHLAAEPPGRAGDPGLERHLLACPPCAALRTALVAPPAELDGLFAPVPAPDRVWRRIHRAAGPGQGWLGRLAGGAGAVVALALLVMGGASAMTRAAEHADESTLIAAVWASRPVVVAYRSAGIAAGDWPSSLRGAGMVCRLRDGRWLVSLLVHNVPAGTRLEEEVVAGTARLTRVLAPVGDTVLDVAAVPARDGRVRWVGVWESSPGGRATLLNWRIGGRLVAVDAGAHKVAPSGWHA